MKWFLKCIRNYVNFSGRARRTEFWYFILFSCLLLIVAMALDVVCFNTPYGVFYLLVALFLFLPQLAVSARRLHDTGRSGWWYGVSMICGTIYIIVACSLVIAALGGSASAADLSSMSSEEIVEALSEGSAMGFIGIGLLAGIIYGIILLIFYCQDSQKEENKYGQSPKYVEENADAESQDTMQTMA